MCTGAFQRARTFCVPLLFRLRMSDAKRVTTPTPSTPINVNDECCLPPMPSTLAATGPIPCGCLDRRRRAATDSQAPNTTVAVFDNGTSMDLDGLREFC